MNSLIMLFYYNKFEWTVIAMSSTETIAKRLKLKDLQIFMTTVDAGGMMRAAKRLNMSQPAVSQAIAALERALSNRLIERSRKGIQLTSYGEALLRGGSAIFDDLLKTVADIQYLADPTAGEVRLGATEPVADKIVSDVIELLSRRYPNITFDLLLREPSGLYRELAARRLDFVVSQTNQNVDADGMDCETLFEESIAVVSGASHRVASRKLLKLKDLTDAAWILPPPNSFISTCLRSAFLSEGLAPPRSAITVHSAYLRIKMLSGGHFLTVAPTMMLTSALSTKSVRIFPKLLQDSSTSVRLVTLKNRSLRPVAEMCMHKIREAANTYKNQRSQS